MTQEEKARAYDEALERAKHYQKVNGSAVISAIFPEIKESEDEKMRNRIINILGNNTDAHEEGWVVYADEISWLKERRDSFVDNSKTLTSEDERILEWIIGIVNACKSLSFKDKVKLTRYLEKRKEQKPVPKFSVGDYVIDTNYKGEPLYQVVYIDKECYICEYRGDKEMGDRAVMHFAFDNPYLRLEQKPAEWSEKDEQYFHNLIMAVDATFGEGTTRKWLQTRFKSLRPQPKSIISDTDKSNLKDAPAIIRKSNHPFKENIALIIEKYL